MTTARKDIYDPDEIGIFHCFSRCVRRAFLCGNDPYTGKDYSHRKEWLEALLAQAAASYTIDLLSFGILDNHFHVLLRNRPDLTLKLSPGGVARRWLLLHPKRRDEHGNPCEPTQKEIRAITQDKKRVKRLRRRLGNISWFMAYVKERIARWANAEDEVTGAFFEKRFEMKSLASEAAVLACSIYVDLNEIRAGVAETPETSKNSSVWRRLQGRAARVKGKKSKQAPPDGWLAPIFDTRLPADQQYAQHGWRASDTPALNMTLEQYLTLVDLSGRIVHPTKPGRIPADLPPLLERLQIAPDCWSELIKSFDTLFNRIAGTAADVQAYAARKGRQWYHGISNCRRYFSQGSDP